MDGLTASVKASGQPARRRDALLLVVFLGLIWAQLVHHLQVDWTVNPQYGYGWAVPFLCLFLIGRQILNSSSWRGSLAGRGPWLIMAVLALIFLYAPTRLVEEANPDWRLVSWALALEVVGLSLLLIYLTLGRVWMRQLLFPIAYFLVAVPWPTGLESPVIQGLTHADATATVEAVGWWGIPAMVHGNVIEVATGQVGIDEACSGIRSFQATLMISLFLGELYQLSFLRRLVLVLGGFALSFVLNLVRMSILVWVAAEHGINAIARWHDPTGVTILLGCFFALWGLGLLLARKKAAGAAVSALPPETSVSSGKGTFPLLVTLLVWVALVDVAVEGWYRRHEERIPLATAWTMAWPTNNPTFKREAIPERAQQILRYNEGQGGAWKTDGISWDAVFLRWNPGRMALNLVQNHTPEVCMRGAGHTLKTISKRQWMTVGSLQMPFMVYEITNSPQPVFVFFCLWDDRSTGQGHESMHMSYRKRLDSVWAGMRNPGQRSLEILLGGQLDAAQAETALQRDLETMIRVEPGGGATNAALPISEARNASP